jgi:disulfide bond formation protein DsbB
MGDAGPLRVGSRPVADLSAMDTQAMILLFALLTVAAQLGLLLLAGLAVLGRWAPVARLRGPVLEALRPQALGLALVVALVATLGSLYLSEVAHFEPCRLCWYQRIAMYPIALLLGVALVRRDQAVRPYALALALAGLPISAYHYLVERFPTLEAAGCDPANPCSIAWVWRFHYISIPLMAASAFALIAALLLVTSPPPAGGDGTAGTEPRSAGGRAMADLEGKPRG